MKKNSNNKTSPQLISYLTLRKTVGIIGISFPVVLVIGTVISGNCTEVQSSISAYYHTAMRDIFVGLLCAIALFLFAYKGYENADAVAGNLACVFALGVAFFPTSVSEPFTSCITEPVESSIISTIHYISAAGLFLVLSYFSLGLFTKKKENPTKMKMKRNKLYRICGFIMLACIALIAINSLCINNMKCQELQKYNPVFWLESLALWSFGISWLTKGNALLTDKRS